MFAETWSFVSEANGEEMRGGDLGREEAVQSGGFEKCWHSWPDSLWFRVGGDPGCSLCGTVSSPASAKRLPFKAMAPIPQSGCGKKKGEERKREGGILLTVPGRIFLPDFFLFF